MITKKIPWVFLSFSVIGFIDALYLSIERFKGTSNFCIIGSDCDKVLVSAYSTIGNIPVAFLGTIYYFIMLILILNYFRNKKEGGLYLISYITCIGFAASVWFVYLQLFVIKSICSYCMISALCSIILFITGLNFLMKNKSSR